MVQNALMADEEICSRTETILELFRRGVHKLMSKIPRAFWNGFHCLIRVLFRNDSCAAPAQPELPCRVATVKPWLFREARQRSPDFGADGCKARCDI